MYSGISGKRSLEQMGGGEAPDSKYARTDDLPPTPPERTPSIRLLDLPRDVLVRITRMLVPDYPFPESPFSGVVLPAPTAPALRVRSAWGQTCTVARDLVSMLRQDDSLHSFRFNASKAEFRHLLRHGYQDRPLAARQACVAHQGIDPNFHAAPMLPMRATWHHTLSVNPAGQVTMDGIPGLRCASNETESLAILDIATQEQVEVLAVALAQRSAVVQELAISWKVPGLDLSSLARSLGQCLLLRHLVIGAKGPIPTAMLDAIQPLAELRSIRLAASTSFGENLVGHLERLVAAGRLEYIGVVCPELSPQFIESLTQARPAFPALQALSLRPRLSPMPMPCMALVQSYSRPSPLMATATTAAPGPGSGAGLEYLVLGMLDPLAALAIAREVRQANRVRHIELAITGAADGVSALCSELLACSALEELVLSTEIDDGAAAVLGQALANQNCSLRRLELMNARFSEAGEVALANGLQVNRSLRAFALFRTPLTATGINRLSWALADNTHLLRFRLDQCSIALGLFNLAMAIALNRSLTSFLLAGGTLSAQEKETFADAVCDNSTLLEITLPPVTGPSEPEQQHRIDQRLYENRMR